MGIILSMMIEPHRITDEEWSSVYRESLVLLEKFQCMDRVPDGNGYSYAVISAHRENVVDNWSGWSVVGDIRTGDNMERFSLISDIAYYRENAHYNEGDENDVLLWDVSDIIPDVDIP